MFFSDQFSNTNVFQCPHEHFSGEEKKLCYLGTEDYLAEAVRKVGQDLRGGEEERPDCRGSALLPYQLLQFCTYLCFSYSQRFALKAPGAQVSGGDFAAVLA
ncbi:Bactericidal Permeability-Increasing Protein [Manis pentadactyla]|nr:Bactericidal Permeability-Increasing Protein [Manis pentadactyla]